MMFCSRIRGWAAPLCGVLLAPCIAAQTPPPARPDPAPASPASLRADLRALVDAATPVPPVVYRSVFTDLPTGVETTDSDWRQANQAVGEFPRGHIDILRWESRHEGRH